MRLLIALVSMIMLGACTALMVGGDASGGHQQGKDERQPNVVVADSAITTKIKGRYAADPDVSVFNIGVRTWRGTVTLLGTVGSYVARDQAESIAKGTGGVKAVNNLIVIEDRSAGN